VYRIWQDHVLHSSKKFCTMVVYSLSDVLTVQSLFFLLHQLKFCVLPWHMPYNWAC
jgi:hypothetical protein